MNILDKLYTAQINPEQFHYETLVMPPWTYFLTPQDVNDLHYIATSKKLAGDGSKRLAYIRQIMEARGFKRFAGGTNRVIYRHLEVPGFVAKIATDQVGMKDNPAEFKVQELIKPFCAKMFQVTPCGTVGFSEKVIPIKNVEEFKIIAEEVFDLLYNNLLGKFVLEDIGTEFFMNYGVRPGFGPVLLDYPYIYELDGRKIICQKPMPNGLPCGGEIDYDDGFNYLHCKRCGKKYDAVELKKYEKDNQIVMIKGGTIPMKVSVMKGDTVISEVNSSDIIPKKTIQPNSNNILKVVVCRGEEEVPTAEDSGILNQVQNGDSEGTSSISDLTNNENGGKLLIQPTEEKDDEIDDEETEHGTETQSSETNVSDSSDSGTREISEDEEDESASSDKESGEPIHRDDPSGSDDSEESDEESEEIHEPEKVETAVLEKSNKVVRDAKGRFVKQEHHSVKTSSKTKKVKIEGNFIPPEED